MASTGLLNISIILHTATTSPAHLLWQAPPITRPTLGSLTTWQSPVSATQCPPLPILFLLLWSNGHQQSVALWEWSGRFVPASGVPVLGQPLRNVQKSAGSWRGEKRFALVRFFNDSECLLSCKDGSADVLLSEDLVLAHSAEKCQVCHREVNFNIALIVLQPLFFLFFCYDSLTCHHLKLLKNLAFLLGFLSILANYIYTLHLQCCIQFVTWIRNSISI